MAAQRFDLGLSELSDTPPGTRSLPLPAMDEVAVLPASHPLAARGTGEQDFAGQPFISLARDDSYRAQIDAVFARAGDAPARWLKDGERRSRLRHGAAGAGRGD